MKEEDDHVCALKGIEAMEAFFYINQMPISLHELGLKSVMRISENWRISAASLENEQLDV